MKTDKKEQFQGAPKGGPSPWIYTRRTRKLRNNVRYFEGLKCVFKSEKDKHDTITRRISELFGKK